MCSREEDFSKLDYKNLFILKPTFFLELISGLALLLNN